MVLRGHFLVRSFSTAMAAEKLFIKALNQGRQELVGLLYWSIRKERETSGYRSNQGHKDKPTHFTESLDLGKPWFYPGKPYFFPGKPWFYRGKPLFVGCSLPERGVNPQKQVARCLIDAMADLNMSLGQVDQETIFLGLLFG